MTGRCRLWLTTLALASAVAVTACNREQAAATRAESTVTGAPTDEQITTAVQARLYGEPDVRAARIDVSTDQRVVMLSGTAQSEQARQRALQLARAVEGVARVEDRMTVVTAADAQPGRAAGTEARAAAETPDRTRTPGWITTKIQAQYFLNPSIKPWNIDVTTSSGGVVTLEGKVDSTEARDEAVRIARATEGVMRVADQLQVAGETAATSGTADGDFDLSDAWLTSKVQSKYYLDDAVRARDIDVTTDNGVVTLAGSVESAEERRRAVALARSTDGVRDVRDQLQVRAAATDAAGSPQRPTGSAVAQGIEDAWITTKIQSQYFLEPDVKGHEIDVDTRNGVVTLSGSVESDARRQQAEQIARDTEGVSRVVNRLTIESAG